MTQNKKAGKYNKLYYALNFVNSAILTKLFLFILVFLAGCSTMPPVGKKEYSTEIESPRYLRYIVQKGDTFWKISQMAYNDSRKWSRIYKANSDKVKDIRDLKPGEVIIIPLE